MEYLLPLVSFAITTVCWFGFRKILSTPLIRIKNREGFLQLYEPTMPPEVREELFEFMKEEGYPTTLSMSEFDILMTNHLYQFIKTDIGLAKIHTLHVSNMPFEHLEEKK